MIKGKAMMAGVLAAVFLLAAASLAAAAQGQYRKVTDGKGNMIFSTKRIALNQEASVPLKTEFKLGEPIFARAYFPGPFGAVKQGEEYFVDIWIDGNHAQRIKYKNPPDPSWDTIQVLIANTGSDEARADLFSGLSKGGHQVAIYCGKEDFMKTKAVAKKTNDGVQVSKEQVYKPVYLSEGKFTLVVP